MCGIYGYIGKDYKKIGIVFPEYLRHRGPDDSGVYYDESKKLVLGHTRLSIIDLSNNARQPMLDESKNYVIVFNGEIYNYYDIKKELKKLGYTFKTKSDTEVVLKSYIEWKENCLKKFRGMFAFAIYDKDNQILFLARDRFGIKPLIYTFLNNHFIFSSELKPFLKTDIIDKKLNIEALCDLILFGSVRQPKTILEGVYQLLPGHYMIVKLDRTYKISPYYKLEMEFSKWPKINNYQEAIQQLRNILESAIKYYLIADVEVGAFLSGGVDSTSVVALMSQYLDKKIKTFSVGFKKQKEVVDETSIAKITAKKLNTEHYEIIVDDNYIANIFNDFIEAIDQPSIDGINTFIVSKETAKKVKVALSGLGGDEIFAGYPHFKLIYQYGNKKHTYLTKFLRWLNQIRPNRFTHKYELIGVAPEKGVFYSRLLLKNSNDIYNILKFNKSLGCVDKLKELLDFSVVQRISLYEIQNYLLNTLLRDTDVVSMYHALEVRPVLLDHVLVEFALSLRDDFKIRNGKLKAIFIEAVKDLIPEEVWKRPKTGFEMPFQTWMNGALNEIFKEVVEESIVKELFKKSFLQNLSSRINNKILKRKDWLYLVLFAWLKRYQIGI
jgi:asparagine synthase (glutamine-hydrolysing)